MFVGVLLFVGAVEERAEASRIAMLVGAADQACEVRGIHNGQLAILFTPDARRIPHQQVVSVKGGRIAFLSETDARHFLIVDNYVWSPLPEVRNGPCVISLERGNLIDGTVVGPDQVPVTSACVEACGASVFTDTLGAFRIWVPADSTCDVVVTAFDTTAGSLGKTATSTPGARHLGALTPERTPAGAGPRVGDDFGASLHEELLWVTLWLALRRADDPRTDAAVAAALEAWAPATFAYKACARPPFF